MKSGNTTVLFSLAERDRAMFKEKQTLKNSRRFAARVTFIKTEQPLNTL